MLTTLKSLIFIVFIAFGFLLFYVRQSFCGKIFNLLIKVVFIDR